MFQASAATFTNPFTNPPGQVTTMRGHGWDYLHLRVRWRLVRPKRRVRGRQPKLCAPLHQRHQHGGGVGALSRRGRLVPGLPGSHQPGQ